MKKILMSAILAAILVCGAGLGATAAVRAHAEHVAVAAPAVNAKSAYLMDFDSGTQIMAQDETKHLPIASMVKIMTLLLAFDEVDKGTLGLEDKIPVSQNAASMGGSQAFLDAGHDYTASDLLLSISIASANDSCVAIAEHIAGSVDGFVAKMNEKAAALGMADSNFANCTGLPAPNHYSCAKDVAVMSRELYRHPQYFTFSKVWMNDLKHESGRVTGLSNTNKLLRSLNGCDGGKTGFTNEALFCMSATAKRDNMRLISVVIGSPDSKTRFSECAKLVNFGFANYGTKQVLDKSAVLPNEISIKGGKKATVLARSEEDAFIFGTKESFNADISVKYELKELKAAVREGDVVGKANVIRDGIVVKECNLVAAETVEAKTFLDILRELFAKQA